ncbi:hypothetical protein L3X38_013955 [Prunus dulcis]|uniref:Uncharacterized protein n=1 Tax=Prunus dulcis TaxID=3755 RepID=A0AAD4WMW9_PRUDU|nr:hypothetical protein L3X38_013955 [Prunus dulcis]
MDGMGLGMLAEQLGELKLVELLYTPPGLDEARVANMHKIFFTLLFMFNPLSSLNIRYIFSHLSAIKSVFGQEQPQLGAADKLERLRETMIKVRELFCETDFTEFVIVTNDMALVSNEFKHSSATSAIKSVFGQEQPQLGAADKLERLRVREMMIKVHELDTGCY